MRLLGAPKLIAVLLVAAGGALFTGVPLAGAQPGGPRAIEISGRVVHAGGSPANGLRIELIPYPDSYVRRLHELTHDSLPSAEDSTISDAQGEFALTAPGLGIWRLMVYLESPKGSATAFIRLDLVPLTESVRLPAIEIPAHKTLEVQLLEPEGVAVADALVMATPARQGLKREPGSPYFPRLVRVAAHTDEQGIARFWVPQGEIQLRIVAEGFLLEGEDTSARRVAVQLTPGPRRALEVRDVQGRLLADALVRAGESLIPIAITDENGRATVSMVGEGNMSYQAETASGDYGSAAVPSAAEELDGHRTFRVVVEPPARVTGRLVDAETGQGVAGGLLWSRRRLEDSAFSDDKGRFSLETWTDQSEEISLQAHADGFLPQSVNLLANASRRSESSIIAMAPTGPSLTGTVVDIAGKPIAGARIEGRLASSNPALRGSVGFLRLRGVSDSTGDFRVSGLLSDGGYQFQVEASGYARRQIEVAPVEVGAVRESITVVLSQGQRVWGTVVDRGGNAISGAEVTLLASASASRRDLLAGMRRVPDVVSTDAQGRFQLDSISVGSYDVRAEHPGFAPTEVPGIEVPEGETEVEVGVLELDDGARLEGLVVDVAGEPLPGARVEILSAPSGHRYRNDQPLTSMTDQRGFFFFDTLRAQQLVSLVARIQGLAPTEVLDLRPPTEQPVVVVLKRGSTIRGRVVDGEGSAIAGVTIQPMPDHQASFPFSQMRYNVRQRLLDHRAQSDDRGLFELRNVPAGTWILSAYDRSGASGELAGVETKGEDLEVEIRIERSVTVTGKVTGPRGNPISGARILLRWTSGNSSRSAGARPSDATGRFHATASGTGPVTVMATHPAFVSVKKELELVPGENVVDLRLEQGLEISGRVTDISGLAVSNALVHKVAETASELQADGGVVATTEDGRFVLRGVTEGEYTVIAGKEGYGEAATELPIEVSDHSIRGVELVLGSGGMIVGRVLGLDFDDLPRVRIAGHPLAGRRQLGYRNYLNRPETGVDYEGRFRIENLRPGDWQITASFGNGQRQVTRVVAVDASEPQAYVELEFEAGHTLTGVVLRQGAPVVAAGIMLARQDGGESRTTGTDQTGAFIAEGLPIGKYSVRIQTAEGDVHTRTLDIVGNHDVRFDLDASAVIEGVVVDADTRLAIGGARLALQGLDSGGSPAFGGNINSNSDGSFRLVATAGSWKLRVVAEGYGQQIVPVDLGPGEQRSGFEVSLQVANLFTLLLTAETGKPVGQVSVFRIVDGGIAGGDSQQVGADGRADFRFLSAGTWDLWVLAERSPPTPVRVTIPGEPVAVTLPPGGRVELRVPQLGGRAVAGHVEVRAVDGAIYRSPILGGRPWPLFGARSQIGPLPLGSWTFEIQTNDGRKWQAVAQVVADQIVQVVVE